MSQRLHPYEFVVTPPAARAIQTGLTEAVAAPVIKFLAAALIREQIRADVASDVHCT